MPKTVICDTSAIFNLHRLRRLGLLKELYGLDIIVLAEAIFQQIL